MFALIVKELFQISPIAVIVDAGSEGAFLHLLSLVFLLQRLSLLSFILIEDKQSLLSSALKILLQVMLPFHVSILSVVHKQSSSLLISGNLRDEEVVS